MKHESSPSESLTVLKFPTSKHVPEPNAGLYRKQREVVFATIFTVLTLLALDALLSYFFKIKGLHLASLGVVLLIFGAGKLFVRWNATVDEVNPIIHVSAESIAAVSSRTRIEFAWDKLDYIEPWFVDEQPALRFGTGDETFYAPESMPDYARFNWLVFQLVESPPDHREAILCDALQPVSELPPPKEHWRRIPYAKVSDTYGE